MFMNYQILTNKQRVEEMDLVKVRGKAQITLPANIRKALGINEGDYLEAEIKDNKVVLIPQMVTAKFESVELSKKGEQMLKESIEDVKKGRVKEFDNVEALITSLKKWS